MSQDGPVTRPLFEVLVVDDSNLNRKMLMKCLKAEKHICEDAADGLQAIEKVGKKMNWKGHSGGLGVGKPYDVILMDFVMPHKDGPTATAELRAMGYTGAIFGVTGNIYINTLHTYIYISKHPYIYT
jgi:CheY-like chemotaxis protein